MSSKPYFVDDLLRKTDCFWIHILECFQGKVKQIVGSTLEDQKGHSSLVTNFESDKPAGHFAKLYKDDGLTGGHAIMLGADPLSKSAAIEALRAYPGRLQMSSAHIWFWVLF